MNRALLIAFQFPPFSGSSGIQRTLMFCKYLRDFGWEPVVLSADPRAYPLTSEDLLENIPADVVVERAFAVDAARHLSIAGRYFGFTALPDRWSSWWFGGVPAGRRLIRRYRPDVIWSTFPIATAHLIGGSLARSSGLPLVADFRDAMVVEHYPEPPMIEWSFRKVEAATVRSAAAVVCTTPTSQALYSQRYRGQPGVRFECIKNGYDEAMFAAAGKIARPYRRSHGPVKLLHSGLIKRIERNPLPFLQAIGELHAERAIGPESLRVVFRAPSNADDFRRMVEEAGAGEIVEVAPSIPYQQALAELMESDGLLLFQGAICNHLIPAKVYEYLRAGRPILALTDAQGDTARILRSVGVDTIVDIDSKDRIKSYLPEFVQMIAAQSAPVPPLSVVQQFSRREQTRELATLFSQVTANASK